NIVQLSQRKRDNVDTAILGSVRQPAGLTIVVKQRLLPRLQAVCLSWVMVVDDEVGWILELAWVINHVVVRDQKIPAIKVDDESSATQGTHRSVARPNLERRQRERVNIMV